MTTSGPFQVSTSQGPDTSEQAGGAPVKGFVNGERVVVKSQTVSPCEDALEEMSFVMSQREKDLKQRKVSDRRRKRPNKAERAEFMIQKLPDLDREQLRKFLDRVRQGRGDGPGELAEKAGRFFKDVSHRYAALRWAGQQLEQDGDKDLSKALETAAKDCLSGNGPDVAAGLNVSGIAREFEVKGFGELQSLRDLYRETMTHSEGLEETYQSILDKYSLNEIPTAIEFLIGAAGHDLRSQNRSAPKAKLKSLVDDLYWLKFLYRMNKDCINLVVRMKKQFGIRLRATGSHVMDKLLKIKKNSYPDENTILTLAGHIGITDHAVKIDFLRECNRIVADFPEKSFEDENARQDLVLTFRSAMDLAVDEEMEAYE